MPRLDHRPSCVAQINLTASGNASLARCLPACHTSPPASSCPQHIATLNAYHFHHTTSAQSFNAIPQGDNTACQAKAAGRTPTTKPASFYHCDIVSPSHTAAMEAAESPKAGKPLHFHMPLSLQRFPKFAELPYDIRHKIWELAIYVPGIHFLRLEPNDEFRPAQWLRNKRLPKELQSNDLPYSSFLRPAFTSAAGDTSHYIQRNQALANLAHSCNEARYLVDRATSHPDNMRLPHAYGQDYQIGTGPLVTLARADDIVCIDYPEMKSTEEHRHLGLWTVNIDNRQFSKIRNVAVRYHITWGEDQRTCTNCGRVHEATRQKPKIPRHLNQFLTLFPKMEMFYLIDCFAVKRKEWRINPGKSVNPLCQDLTPRLTSDGGRPA